MTASTPPPDPPFNPWRLLQLSSFQIGSAMGDILVTAIWNRIMIVTLGLPAWPIALLIALRYLLTPLSLWAGFRSDTRPLFGLRRTPYIWLGRGMMVAAMPLLGLSLTRFVAAGAAAAGDVVGWLLALAFFVLYGSGSLLSGSPFLALVRDSVPKPRQGLAVTTLETTLIVLFPIVAIVFSVWMRDFSLAVFWQMVLATAIVGGLFWFLAILGVERRAPTVGAAATAPGDAAGPDFRATFGRIWADSRVRLFCAFLALATLAAWAQDAILEPFGAEVVAQNVGQTTRYSAYWQGATALVLIAILVLWRRRAPEQQKPVARLGLSIMAAGMAGLAVAALTSQPRLVTIALIVFGIGFGLYTYGGLSLMVVMTSDTAAGAFLGLWTITILLSRGVGIFLGGALRDILLHSTGSPELSYGIIFGLEALGLLGAAWLLSHINIEGFARDTGRVNPIEVQVAAAEM